MTGSDKNGELVEDSTDTQAEDSIEAVDLALPKMLVRSGIVEVSDVRVSYQ